jgi:hypothetical protein
MTGMVSVLEQFADVQLWDALGLFLFLAGFVIGLGAVTVIDFHGLFGRKSAYWTEATTRTHKVTKPLIWLGMILAIVGGAIFYRHEAFIGVPLVHAALAAALLLNGCFLSFRVSPFLLRREREGRASELLPDSWQRAIAVSFVISFVGWWGSLLLLVLYMLSKTVA